MLNPFDLSKFGEVEICKETDELLHIKVTKGFKNNASNIWRLMGKIEDKIWRKFPVNNTLICEDDLFEIIIKIKPIKTNEEYLNNFFGI